MGFLLFIFISRLNALKNYPQSASIASLLDGVAGGLESYLRDNGKLPEDLKALSRGGYVNEIDLKYTVDLNGKIEENFFWYDPNSDKLAGTIWFPAFNSERRIFVSRDFDVKIEEKSLFLGDNKTRIRSF